MRNSEKTLDEAHVTEKKHSTLAKASCGHLYSAADNLAPVVRNLDTILKERNDF